MPPPWLSPEGLDEILELETKHFQESFSPAPQVPQHRLVDYDGKPFHVSDPFLGSCTADAAANALPYHWFELSEILLEAASDDLVQPDDMRRLLRDIREVRLAKMRKGVELLTGDGDDVQLDGVGAMEISESRGFITGVVDGLRKIGASREQARRERDEEERENGQDGQDEDEDEDMT